MEKEKLDFTTAKHYKEVLQKTAKEQRMQMGFSPLQKSRIGYTFEVLKMIWFLNKIIPKNKRLVFLCIGASNYIGDMFGPYIGQLLQDKADRNIIVYGNMEKSVHGNNLLEYIENIYKKHKDDFVIAIDAGTSKGYKTGTIMVYRRGICPGRSFYSGTAKVGDVSILGFTEENYEKLLALSEKDTYLYDMIYFTAHALIKYVQWFNPLCVDIPDMKEEQKLIKKKTKKTDKTKKQDI
jgi:putative sporulation protein YyaC